MILYTPSAATWAAIQQLQDAVTRVGALVSHGQSIGAGLVAVPTPLVLPSPSGFNPDLAAQNVCKVALDRLQQIEVEMTAAIKAQDAQIAYGAQRAAQGF